jgi:hypothetical protein
LLGFLLSGAAAFATADEAQPNDTVEVSHATLRDSIVAKCEQQYSASQCQDEQFLNENFHLQSLDVAHRAGIRRDKVQRSALRELTLQRACNEPFSKVCGAAEDPQRCVTDLVQSCTVLKNQTVDCLQNVQHSCAADSNRSACIQQQAARCPSIKKQPTEVLLAKYPKLSPAQKNLLANTAQQLDAEQSYWPTGLLNLLGLLALL